MIIARKRALSLLLGLVVLLIMLLALSTTAWAAEPVLFIGSNSAVTLPGDGATTYSNNDQSDSTWWVTKTGESAYTLTLNGANITTASGSGNAYGVYFEGIALNIELLNASTIDISSVTAGGNHCYGIWVGRTNVDDYSSLSFSGNGTLSVKAGVPTGTTETPISAGIRVNGDLTVNGGTINAYGGSATATDRNSYSYGVYVDDGALTVNSGATLNGIGGGATASGTTTPNQGASYPSYGESVGVCLDGAASLLLNGGALSGQGGASSRYSYGVGSWGADITLNSGATLTGTGGAATATNRNSYSYGVYIDGGDLTLNSGATLTSNGGVATANGTTTPDTGSAYPSSGESAGIWLDEGASLLLNGGALSGQGGVSDGYSYGVGSWDADITVNSGTFSATGGAATADQAGTNDNSGLYPVESFGLGGLAGAQMRVNGGTVTVSGGAATNGAYNHVVAFSAGVFGSDFGVRGGVVTATGGAASAHIGESVGVYCQDVAVSGGKLTSSGGAASGTAVSLTAGIYAARLDVCGGEVAAAAGDGTSCQYSVGIYANLSEEDDPLNPNGSVVISKGTLTAQCAASGKQATTANIAMLPAFSVAANTDFTATASVNQDGSAPADAYDAGEVATYKYLRVVATPLPGDGSGRPGHVITATAGEGGTITPSGRVSVKRGGDKSFTITPAAGYIIADLLVDGKSVGAVSEYTFADVDEKHSIDAVFAKAETAWVNPYTDVKESDWFYDYVRDLSIAGVVNGYPDATFRPGGTVTYGEALTLIMKAVGYADIAPSGQHWASGYMDKALADRLIDAVIPNLDAPITRLEVAEIAAKALKLPAPVNASAFSDTDAAAVRALFEAGIVEGSFDADGKRLYKPNANITRAEITTIIWRINNHNK